ncbi:M4 family metallopeptidase [Spirosoma sordidisoli]|uniref:T9SS type A sorting domain-containing protein n=1 Tax=Spirosoma sordidisoli TaxID=2502893 RepID=A0A4Q2UEE4_9BACT|nr:M4 family metallopeptidase [Spirosoma sordidisoli]RYC67256.1 T9SS type A sorting domain-containing protein [Spirosoma sordidisoli]
MKAPVLFLTLLTASVALAQPPKTGFSRKTKTTVPSVNVAQRLAAQVIPTPKNRLGQQTLLATGLSRPSAEPLRLRVIRDTSTGLPVFIERTLSKRQKLNQNAGARLSAAAASSAAFQFMGQIRGLLQIDAPEASFTVASTRADELGQTHVRLTQLHRGVPVVGSELVAHLTGTDVTVLNGRYQPIPNELSTQPKLALAEATKRALTDVRQAVRVRSFGDNILNVQPIEGSLCVYPMAGGARLAYQLTVRPNLLDRWEYVIDAQTGEVLDKYNHTCSITRPLVPVSAGTDAATAERPAAAPLLVAASGRDLNGTNRTFQTYQQGGTYFLIDTSRPMFNAQASTMPNEPVGAIWTVDAQKTYGDNQKVYQITSANNTDWSPTAVSAHYNAGIAYDYYRTTFGRSGLNGSGGTMISLINVVDDDGAALDNAYWNGKIMAYGNGKLLKPLAGALDVAGHEMTHGVIQNTANLQYKNQSGAINESMADVFAVLIDRDDWRLGEDVAQPNVLPSGALRDLSNPNQGGPTADPNGYQPATMLQYDNTTEDNGGVHINSGIPNFAFYKFATAVGREKAEKVYYRALTTYLTRSSQFVDLRLAVIKAAADLYGTPGAEVTAAQNAFTAVGILDSAPTTPTQPDVPIAAGQDLLLLSDAESSRLYSTTVGTSTAKFDQKTSSSLLHRPSVTDDGKVAFYVSSDKRIRSVNLTGTPVETIISDEPIWDNVAISKDGTKLAALTADRDGSIYVYSYAKKKWAEFKLYNPTYTEGVETGDVRYADSFEWDFTGEFIVYDAFNELQNASGENIDYWDVGFINVWDNKANDFATGTIEKLFSDLDEGESIGNPSFSKNSPGIIAFDYVQEANDIYYVVAVDLSRNADNLRGIYRNNTLGFPSYSRLDNRIVFSTESGTSEDVAGISLAADKLTPSGTAQVLYTGAKWPVWYTQATRVLPTKTTQTITFDAIPDRYTDQGDMTLRATSSAGLSVGFQVIGGPAVLTSANILKINAAGAVKVRAYQEGNTLFYAATPVERTFTVLAVTGTEPAWSEAMSVYPNPTRATLTVDLPASETLEAISLRSVSGAIVTQPAIRGRQRTATLDLQHLPKGLYFLHVQTPSGTAHRKVMKD